MNEGVRKVRKMLRDKKEYKISKSIYYTTKSLMGIHWWQFAWLIGSRGRGKSFGVVDTVVSFQERYGIENVKCYYFRISDASIKMMLANGAAKAIDSQIIAKYNMDISVRGNTIYNHGKPCMTFYPLVSAAKIGKGIAEYDPDFLGNQPKGVKRFVFMIIDEFMMADGIEKKSIGSPVEQFKIYYENILRDQQRLNYPAVRIFGCANAVSECSDFLAQIAGFVPEKPGRYRLKRKHMIVDNIPNSEAYIEKRKKSYGADIMDYENDANYTNVIKRDLETLKPKSQKLNKVSAIIKFSKDPAKWYTLWDGRIIGRYNKQTSSTIIPMRRYLDSMFNEEAVKMIIERYDARSFMYTDLISQATFAAELKQIKSR